ncbi:MAG: protein DpdE [Cyanobacteriota bacterium]|nr:protein DpdE [Cyanobacteriota bacterium]
MLQPGHLASSTENNLGIGKIVEIHDEELKVEYFCSVGQRIAKSLPLSSLRPVKLQPQMRCYLWSESQETWRIGRIFDWDEERHQYRIDLPGQQTEGAFEQNIYVRCNLPIADAIEILALKGHDTAYFHNQRSQFVRCLVEQRAASRGMTGLISANIELFAHQVEVIRRVLEDPIQRYLLADEVGLGKTIEAGVILRQYLLDEPHGRALVLVPPYLREQWSRELEDKFYLSDFSDRVQLLAVDDAHQIGFERDFDFVVIDEAHHIAAMATSSQPAQRQLFDTCKHLAHTSDRLLLLSATPVLNHEQDFLAMLHLLEPATYRLDNREGFRARVQNRQEIGRFLLSFKEGAKPFVLKKKLNQLRNLFAEDSYLLRLGDRLQTYLHDRDTPATERDKIVRTMRTYISDTYRLHRRMLRSRRDGVEDVLFERNAVPKTEYDLDERSYPIHELIDEWRTVAPNAEYCRIFLLLFRASSTWLGILKQVVEARLHGVSHPGLIQEFGADDIRLLIETPKFPQEEDILQGLLDILQHPSAEGDRLELLKTILLHRLSEIFGLQSFKGEPNQLLERVQQRLRRPFASDRLEKIAIFTSFGQTCSEIVSYLSKTFGEVSVASHQLAAEREQVENNINKFKDNPRCFLLVCDSSGEEGRNLQFADGLIHFDLPWSPNRLEQRLGRLDRIGNKMGTNFWLLVGSDLPDSLQDTWYQLLNQGLNIFRRSIASFQFYVDEKLPKLEEILFESGASGLLGAIESISAEIKDEQVKNSEQNVLDEIATPDRDTNLFFRKLEQGDENHQKIERATEGWICNALRFCKQYDPNLSGVRCYKRTQKTLVPARELIEYFSAYINASGTYDRRLANQYSGIDLYRIGQESIEQLTSYIHWDDRGRAFAMWRHEPSWETGEGMEWVGFRFDYVIEANLAFIEQVVKDRGLNNFNQKALRRQADDFFPPQIKTIFFDNKMEIVEDAECLKILQRSYRETRHDYDYNLGTNRLPILDEFIDPDQWANFCRDARQTSENLLRDRTSFANLCQDYTQTAERKLEHRLNLLRRNLNPVGEIEQMSDSELAKEIQIQEVLNQALLEGIQHPHIYLDSVGFIIVSGRHPPQ